MLLSTGSVGPILININNIFMMSTIVSRQSLQKTMQIINYVIANMQLYFSQTNGCKIIKVSVQLLKIW